MLSVINSAVYDVTPHNSNCDHCQDLQHYLLNVNFSASNTQLNFLPGLHHLPTNLIIQNVHNISLIGIATNGATPDTVIQCTSSVGIVMDNITELKIQNIVIKNCKTQHHSLQVAVCLKGCSFVQLQLVQVYQPRHVISLVGINILGDSYINNITCLEMHFYYTNTVTRLKRHKLLISHYHIANKFKGKYGIYLNMLQYSYEVTFHLLNTFIQDQKLRQSVFLFAISNNSVIQNTVHITNFQFTNNCYSYLTFTHLFHFINISIYFSYCQFLYNRDLKCQGLIRIDNGENVRIFQCTFNHNIFVLSKNLIEVNNILNTTIKHCYFFGNNMQILAVFNSTEILVSNVTFSNTRLPLHFWNRCIIQLSYTSILLSGAIKFYQNILHYRCIIKSLHSNITVYGYIEFSRNYALTIIKYQPGYTYYKDEYCQRAMIKVKENTTIAIISNEIFMYFLDLDSLQEFNIRTFKICAYHQCFFQYYYSTGTTENIIDSGNIFVHN